MTEEWSRYRSFPRLGVDLLHAHFRSHVYARHAHDSHVVGVVERGVPTFRYRGGRHQVAPGRIMILNPEEPHDGRSAQASGYEYRMLYVRQEAFAAALLDDPGRRTSVPCFREPEVDDPALARQLRRVHAALSRSGSDLESESLLLDVVRALTARHSGWNLADDPSCRRIDVATSRARDYVHAHFAEDFSLATLAGVAELSRFQLSRRFTRAYGLPPHAYLVQLRVRAARNLLAAGQSPAQVAYDTGFADQSHLARRIKSAYGVTPRQVRAAMR